MKAKKVRHLTETVIADRFLDPYPSLSSLYLSGSLVRREYMSGFGDVDLIAVGEKIEDAEVKKLKRQVKKALQGIEVSLSRSAAQQTGAASCAVFDGLGAVGHPLASLSASL